MKCVSTHHSSTRRICEVFSQEVRLASDGGGAFDWLVGAFYQEIDREYGQNLPTPGYDAFLARIGLPPSSAFNAPPDTPFYSKVPFTVEQIALFGEGTWRFADQWSLTGGVRYYDFDEERELTFAGVFADVGYTRVKGETSSDGFSPRAILSFEPNDDVLLTAQVARGFRLGGINDPLNVSVCTPEDLQTYNGQPTFEDEKVLNYELGAKTRLADGRVTFNAAVFYSDIEDLQVIADAGSCSSRIVLNAQAESIGAEMELFARPSANWDLGLSATWVNAEITETRVERRGPADRGHPRRQPSADLGGVPGLGERYLQVVPVGSTRSIHELHGSARRLVVHPARRSGAGLRLRGLSGCAWLVRLRRSHHQQLQLRSGVAVV